MNLSLEGKREKRVVTVLAVTVIAVCLGGVGWFVHLQNALASPTQSLQAQLEAQNESLILKGPKKERTIERAKKMREEWQTWVQNHRAILRQMMNAKPDDQAALANVWNAIPSTPFEAIPSMASSTHSVRSDPDNPSFTWNAIDKLTVRASTPDMQKHLRASQVTQDWRLQHDFKEQHDVQLAQSINTGTVSITLWASGRITESTDVDPPRGEHNFAAMYQDHREIVPPYDFLR